ncbi:MAG: tetratricopeptide repeat protein, partial [Myxococcota bacterium]
VKELNFPPLSQDYALERASSVTGDGTLAKEQLLLDAYSIRSGRSSLTLQAAGELAVSFANRGAHDAARRWLAIAENLTSTDSNPRAKARHLRRRGRVFLMLGDADEAVASFESAASTTEKHLGANAASMPETLTGLASALQDAGRMTASQEALNRAFSAAASLGGDHPRLLPILHAQISLDRATGNLARDLSNAERALQIAVTTYGHDHPFTANVLTALGVSQALSGRPENGLSSLRKAANIFRRRGSAYDLDLHYTLGDIGDLLRTLGKATESADALEQSYNLVRRLLPETDTRVVMALNNLGYARAEQGRFEEATQIFNQAIELLTRTVGPKHPNMFEPVGGLGHALLLQNRYADAIPVFERHLELTETVFGSSSIRRAQSFYNLGVCYRGMSQLDKAEEFYSASLEVMEESGPATNPSLSYPLITLASVAIERGQLDDAVARAERALPLAEGDAIFHADAQAVLSKALWLQRSQRTRARALADAAVLRYEGIGTRAESNLKEFKTWRDEHGL